MHRRSPWRFSSAGLDYTISHPAPAKGPERDEPPPAFQTSISLTLIVRIVLVAVAIVGITTVGALLFAEAQPHESTAQVDVIVGLSDISSSAEADRLLASLEIMGSGPLVEDAVSERTGLPLADVQGALDTRIVGRSAVMRIRATHPDSATALAIVSAAAERFVELLTTEASPLERNSIEAEIQSIEASLPEIDQRLDEIDEERRAALRDDLTLVTTAEEQRLLAQSVAMLTRVSFLENRLFDAELTQSQRANVLGQAELVGEGSALPRRQAIGLGGFIGLLLASVAAVLLWQVGARPRKRQSHGDGPNNAEGV